MGGASGGARSKTRPRSAIASTRGEVREIREIRDRPAPSVSKKMDRTSDLAHPSDGTDGMDGSVGSDGSPLTGLLSQIMTLEATQQHALLQMLEQLENGKTRKSGKTGKSSRARGGKTGKGTSARGSSRGSSGGRDHERDHERDPGGDPGDDEERLRSSERRGESYEGEEERNGEEIRPAGARIAIELRSTWTKGQQGGGTYSVVGLTEVALYDATGERIHINPAWLSVRSGRVGAPAVNRTTLAWTPRDTRDTGDTAERCTTIDLSLEESRALSRVVDGHTKTTKENHMWRYDTAAHGGDGGYRGDLILEITLPGVPTTVLDTASPSPIQISKLVIWNYNQSLSASAIGVRAARVFLDGTERWQGTIRCMLYTCTDYLSTDA